MDHPSAFPTADAEPAASWFPVSQTHPIRLAGTSRVVLHSAGLGWRNAYASITSGRVWNSRVPAIEHASFAYCLRGANRVERKIDGEASSEVVTFRPRQMGILPTHAPAHYDVRGGADVLLVYLRSSMVLDVAAQVLGSPVTPIHFEPRMGFLDPLLEQIFLAMIGALHRQDPVHDPRYVDQLAVMAAAHSVRTYRIAEAAPAPEALSAPLLPSLSASVHRVCGYIEAHLDGDLSLDSLAREAKLSPTALTQAFAQLHGATPHQWVIRRRVEAARRLLIETGLPLSQIALQAGFASQSHLSAVFKRVTGETPNGFRRAR